MRERFDGVGRIVGIHAMSLHVVELTGVARVLDLRLDRNLDALGLDDQISTSRAPEVWAACHRLTDLVTAWYGVRCHGIVYRSRTTPQHSGNLAFFAHTPLRARTLGRLQARTGLLAACAVSDGFTIENW